MLWTLAAVDDLLASRRPVRAPKRRERGKLGRNFFSRRGLKRKVGWRAQRSSHAHTQSPSQTNISYLLYTSYLETCRHLCPSVVSSDQSVMSQESQSREHFQRSTASSIIVGSEVMLGGRSPSVTAAIRTCPVFCFDARPRWKVNRHQEKVHRPFCEAKARTVGRTNQFELHVLVLYSGSGNSLPEIRVF